jgi:N-acetylglucosaminyl-diphospho-decaprenol L-rhamnosyltransferase
MTKIHVAIVIVTYRTADLTIDCLRSIEKERNNEGLRVTAVVVDNSLEDVDAVQLAVRQNGWSDWASVAPAPRNGGFAYGNNFGIQLSQIDGSPDYIHLLNPDTVLRAGAIDALVRFLEANPKVGIAGSSFENLDGSDWPIAFRFPTILSELEEGLQLGLVTKLLRPWVVSQTMGKSPEMVDWVPGASMMIRRLVLDVIGGLDESYFLYFEETDFCLRAQRKGFQTWYVPPSRVMHIAGQSTKVTERDVQGKRMPAYWFESRRRFFLTAYGMPYAILADIVAVIARFVGSLKSQLLGNTKHLIPFFVSDLVRYSLVWPRNRQQIAAKSNV